MLCHSFPLLWELCMTSSMPFQHRLAIWFLKFVCMYSASPLWKTWSNFSWGFGPVASRLLCCSKQSSHSEPTHSLIKPYIPRVWPIVTSSCCKRSDQVPHPDYLHFVSTKVVFFIFEYLYWQSPFFWGFCPTASRPLCFVINLSTALRNCLNAWCSLLPSPAVARGSQHLKHLNFFSANLKVSDCLSFWY